MTPGQLLELLEVRSVRLFLLDGFFKYRAPAGAYTDELRALVAEHRQTLIDDWRCWQCQRIGRQLYGHRDFYPPVLRCRECFLAWFPLGGCRDRSRHQGEAVSLPPVCPGCRQPQERHTYPLDRETDPGEKPKTWWCNPCLTAKVTASISSRPR